MSLETALQRSVNALTGVEMTEAEAEQALRREACELASELIREYVRDGACSVTIRFEGVPRAEWEEIELPVGSYYAETKWQAIAGRRVLVEYVVADDLAERRGTR